jgi:hypothetical protein
MSVMNFKNFPKLFLLGKNKKIHVFQYSTNILEKKIGYTGRQNFFFHYYLGYTGQETDSYTLDQKWQYKLTVGLVVLAETHTIYCVGLT